MRLQLSNLTYAYNSSAELKFPDLTLLQDEHLLVLGPSGSGKSTLLHLMAALLPPKKGNVLIEGQDPHTLSTARQDAFRAKNISLVWQKAYFVQALSVLENLRLTQKLAQSKSDEPKIKQLAQRLNVATLLSKKPAELSLGEQQRFSIVRAVLNSPKLILADEPTSALDDENAQKVVQLLLEMAKETGASLVVVTHDARIKNHFTKSISL